MKRIIGLLLSCLLIFSSCDVDFRNEITEIHKEIDELRSMLEHANSNIEALQSIVAALESNDYVTSVTPMIVDGEEVGYTINFSKSGPVTIYQGEAPQMSVKKDSDGVWYWTVDDEWVLDGDGNKVRAEGVAPIVKIENERWYISYDDGESWNDLGEAKGDSMFKEVRVDENEGVVIFVMAADGMEYAVPLHRNVRIHLDVENQEAGVFSGSEIIINYTLENATDSTFVTASSNGVYSVRVVKTDLSSGKIIVKAPYIYSDGYINIMVSDGSSFSFIRVVNFFENKMEFPLGLEYVVEATGQELRIPFSTNFKYIFKVDEYAADWISIDNITTKAETVSGDLNVRIARNDFEQARSGKIYVIPENSAGDSYTEITINQKSAFVEIEQTKYAIEYTGAKIETNIKSTRGLSLKVPEEAAGWLNATTTNPGINNYKLIVDIRENTDPEIRSAIVELWSDDGNIYLGSVEFVQAGLNTDDINKIVLILRANVSNDFKVSIDLEAIRSEEDCDCYIDWGDSQAEHITIDRNDIVRRTLEHQYNVSTPQNFEVTITGNVPVFKSTKGVSCIYEVKQWGRTGLREVAVTDIMLKSIAPDTYGSFIDLESISFYGCSNLTSIPDGLLADCRNIKEYTQTFEGCTSLTSIPEGLFNGSKAATGFMRTFHGCTSLTEIPEKLFDQCKNVTTFDRTFEGCANLKRIPAGLFSKCTELQKFIYTFSECTALETIPSGLFAECRNVTDFLYTFNRCTALTAIPSKLFQNNSNVTSFKGIFSHTGLKEIPVELFATCTIAGDFSYTFKECDGLTSLPAGIFDNNRKVKNFTETFAGCDCLTGESPYTIIDGVKYHLYERARNLDHFVAPSSYSACFSTCDKLDDLSEIKKNKWYR